MVDIARRNLFQEKFRFLISSGGVALAIMLILILNGFFDGLNRQVTAYLDNSPADIVVAQKELRNFVGTNSEVPLSAGKKIEEIEGVKKVTPVFVSYAVLEISDRKIFALLIGFDPEKGGGPWDMQEGSADISNSELIFDQAAAKRNHLMLGDELTILGKKIKIVGFSGGTSSWMTGTTFITFDTAAQLRRLTNKSGYFLVEAEDGRNIRVLQKKIADEVPDLSVVSKKVISKNDVEVMAGVFSGPIKMMVAIAFLIGLMLVGLTIYTATVERAKEYGVLKAMGMKNSKLYLVVFEQALIASVIGFIAGAAASFGLAALINNAFPQFLVLITRVFILNLLPLVLLISILASYVPIRVIANIDPAIAFRRGV